MGSDASDETMALLNELASLKELNRKYEANPNEVERDEYRRRCQRHEEITQKIKTLAEKKKKAQPAS